jgi:hypothetical protein
MKFVPKGLLSFSCIINIYYIKSLIFMCAILVTLSCVFFPYFCTFWSSSKFLFLFIRDGPIKVESYNTRV